MIVADQYGFTMLVLNLISKLLPAGVRDKYKQRRTYLEAITFLGILFFLLFRVMLYEFCIPGASTAVGLLGNISLLLFTIFLGWRFLKPNKIKAIACGCLVFILFIGILSFVNSISFTSGKDFNSVSIEKLKTLGYVDWSYAGDDIEKIGVVHHDSEQSFKGLNIYCSQRFPEAYLIDMQGNIVHKWSKDLDDCRSWDHHVELVGNGELLVVAVDKMILKVNYDSEVIWNTKIRTHHDISVGENNKLYALAREDKLVFWHGIPVPILSDYIGVLSPDGILEKKVFFYDLLKDKVLLRHILKIHMGILNPENFIKVVYRKIFRNFIFDHGICFDIFHTNSIEVLNRTIPGFCRDGDLLLSARELDIVVVIDPVKEELVWDWGTGQLDKQHHPSLLENGNVLVFDNGRYRGFSRIVEVNPLTETIEWKYETDPKEKFFSSIRGGCQRLPNGNTLITESNRGRVFEITKEGKIVWEFYNPDVEQERKKRATIYRMMRIIDPEKYDLKVEKHN